MNFKGAQLMFGPYTPFLIFSAVLICVILALAACRITLLIYYIMSQRGGGGVPSEILSKIPILKYSSTQDREEESFRLDHTECYICIGEWEDGEQVMLLPSCNHAFHASCIVSWLKIQSNCPICRSPITRDCQSPSSVLKIASEKRVCYCSNVPETPPSDHHHDHDNQVLHDHHHNQLMNNDDPGSMSRFLPQPCPPPLLLHSVSFSRSHTEKKPHVVGRWLKRSLSENQSSMYVAITIQRGSETASSTTTSSSTIEVVTTTPCDRMSLLLMRSFSQCRNNGNVRSNQILPV